MLCPDFNFRCRSRPQILSAAELGGVEGYLFGGSWISQSRGS